MTWQPIETAPRDGTPVLTLAPASIQSDAAPKPFYAVTFWVVETETHWEQYDSTTKKLVHTDASHWDNWEDPTHWMLLPEPPKE